MPGPLSNSIREAFCQHYALNRNAAEAGRHIGITMNIYRFMSIPEVAERIKELEDEAAHNSGIDKDRVMQIWWQIANVDANEFSQNRIGSCRYCHGQDHEFQWKTPREFREQKRAAIEKFKLSQDLTHEDDVRIPSDAGGYGYRMTRPPNTDCPECDGIGIQYQVFPDTTKLKSHAAFAYQGTEVTRQGVKVNFAGKTDALASIAKAIGMFNDQKPLDVSDSAQKFLETLMGSKAPLSK